MSKPVIYRMKPVFEILISFNHSSSMYTLKNLIPNTFSQEASSNLKPAENTVSSSDENILFRQNKLLKDLLQLHERVNIFRQEVQRQMTEKASSSKVAVNIFQEVDIQDLVVNADPEYPPYSLLWLPNSKIPINISVHVHSSLTSLPEKLTIFNRLNSESPSSPFKLTFVWKNVGPDTQLILSPIKNKIILGEMNVLRFFDELMFPNEDALSRTKIDEILDMIHSLNHISRKEVYSMVTKLSSLLGNNKSFSTSQNSVIADIAVWSGLFKKTELDDLPSNLKQFVLSFSSQLGINPMDKDQNKKD